MADKKRSGTIGIHLENAPGVKFTGHTRIYGADTAILIQGSAKGTEFGQVTIDNMRSAVSEQVGAEIPVQLFMSFVDEMRRTSNKTLAVERSGIKKWLIDHGLEAANFIAAVTQFFR